jgi:hypothetical protein
MEDASILHRDVLTTLEGWSGFQALASAMQAFARTEVFIAGGVLRDVLSTQSSIPKDFDFFVSGPDTRKFISRLGERGTFTLGPFGSPRWWPSGEQGQYADVISIEGFYNGLWKCRNIVDVLNQFDFTANAVALDLRSKRLFDPENGVRDARERVMRAVRFDYPDEPISAHCPLSRLSVLWVRLVHYANTLGFSIEPITRSWLRNHARFKDDIEVFSRLFFPPDVRFIEDR